MEAFLIVVTGILTLFALLSVAWGVDSRDFSSDPHRPDYPVTLSI